MSRFFQLEVIDVKHETKDSVSVAFEIPHGMDSIFNFKAGQYITLKFNLKGEEVRRSYSLCSAPFENSLRIGVKRVENGIVSNHINDTIKVGSIVDIMPPEGRFVVKSNSALDKSYVLFAAGSGITPVLSIVKSILKTSQSKVYLMYGNHNQESIMFKEDLQSLQNSYKDRFVLVHALSNPKSSFWSSKNKLEHRKGRVDTEAINWFLNEYPIEKNATEYFICGPGTMIENTERTLLDNSIEESQIHIESFGDANTKDEGTNAELFTDFTEAKLTAFLDDETIEISVPKGKTILRALIDNRYDPPYSCEGGVCSTCICLLKKGEVHMRNNVSLTDGEIEQGYILSCQAEPLTSELEVDFDD